MKSLLGGDKSGDIALARRTARGLSLLFIGVIILILVLNEDFRSTPTLPTVVLWVTALSTLVAWRWEKAGGILTLFLTSVFLISLLVQWSDTDRFLMPIWELILFGVCWMAPFIGIGAMFIWISRQGEEVNQSNVQGSSDTDVE